MGWITLLRTFQWLSISFRESPMLSYRLGFPTFWSSFLSNLNSSPTLLIHSVPATLNFLVIIRQSKRRPASRPLHKFIPVPRTLFPQMATCQLLHFCRSLLEMPPFQGDFFGPHYVKQQPALCVNSTCYFQYPWSPVALFCFFQGT